MESDDAMGLESGLRAARSRAVEGDGVEVDSVAGIDSATDGFGTDLNCGFAFVVVFNRHIRSAKLIGQDLRKKDALEESWIVQPAPQQKRRQLVEQSESPFSLPVYLPALS